MWIAPQTFGLGHAFLVPLSLSRSMDPFYLATALEFHFLFYKRDMIVHTFQFWQQSIYLTVLYQVFSNHDILI